MNSNVLIMYVNDKNEVLSLQKSVMSVIIQNIYDSRYCGSVLHNSTTEVNIKITCSDTLKTNFRYILNSQIACNEKDL